MIQATLRAVLPAKRKRTPTGWESFNAICCHNRGEKVDKRGRGGVIFHGDGFTYHCFNCNFKAGWTPGHVLSGNTRKLLIWLGVPESEVQKLTLEAIRAKEDMNPAQKTLNFVLEPRVLPTNCKTFDQWVSEGCDDTEFIAVVEYILSRNLELGWYTWMWSSENGYRDRVIIPYYYEGTVVGWTARKISNGNPKYLSSSQPSYVFNLDKQSYEREYAILNEGPLDAIAIDGIGVLSNELNEMQIARINSLGKEIIVVPDNDKSGIKLITTALDQGWSVSLPEWGDDVKDVADAVKKYGRVYTLYTILKYRERSPIKITMLKKRIEKNAEK